MTNPAQVAARAHKVRLDAQRPNSLARTTTAPTTMTTTTTTPTAPAVAGTTHQPMPASLETRLCATCYQHGYQSEATLVTVTGHPACANHADTITEQRRP